MLEKNIACQEIDLELDRFVTLCHFSLRALFSSILM